MTQNTIGTDGAERGFDPAADERTIAKNDEAFWDSIAAPLGMTLIGWTGRDRATFSTDDTENRKLKAALAARLAEAEAKPVVLSSSVDPDSAAPQPAAEAWQPIASAPKDRWIIIGAKRVWWLAHWLEQDDIAGWSYSLGDIVAPDFEPEWWSDHVPLWNPSEIETTAVPGSSTPVGAIPPEGLAAAEAALERLEARKAVPADEWAAQVAGAFVELGSDAESLGTRRVDPAAAGDAVGIVERMREKWNYSRKFYCGPIDCNRQYAEARYSAFIEAADAILAALRGEAR